MKTKNICFWQKIKKYILLSVLLQANLFASGGSVYSRFGLGDFYYSYSARRMAIGELGIAAVDYDYLNFLNPASWSKLRLTRIETGIIYNGNNISSNASSVYHAQTIFTGFMFGFPINHENGISFTVGILPFSNVDYDVNVDETNQSVDSYKMTFSGKGGLSKALVGLSYKLPFNFAIGTSLDYYVGKITHQSSVEFQSGSNFRNGSFQDEYSYGGIGFTVGLISSNIAPIIGLEKLNDFRIGLTYSNSSKINADTVNNSSTIIGTIKNSSGKITAKLPYRIGAGISFIWSKDYLFLIDYLYQPFSSYTQNDIHINELRDLQKVSLGMEYRKAELRSQSFWEQVMLRGGISYEQTQYQINGKGINQLAVYTGFSIPLGFDNTLDFAFQFGKRGTKENNLLSEKIYKFSITLSIGELWFVRQER